MSGADFTLGQRLQRAGVIALSRMPAPLLRLLVRPPRNRAGDRMVPDIALLMKLGESGEDYSNLSPSAARELIERDLVLFGDRVDACAVEHEVELAEGLWATRYSCGPSLFGGGQPARALILFFHGGGFVLGSRASYAGPARILAHGTSADVLSVEYRLAPEHPFPTAHDDALAAWRYVLDHAVEWGVDPHRVVVAGESAGGNIAAVLCQQVRGESVQPLLQVLIQPITDLSVRRRSQEEFAESPALSSKQIAWFIEHYLPVGTDHHDPRVSPLLTGDLAGLPQAVVALGGFDPLHDDGLAYATALLESGVPATVIEEPGQVHGYLSFTGISPSSKRATERIVHTISAALDESAGAITVAKGRMTAWGPNA